jgi:hypothetical protein
MTGRPFFKVITRDTLIDKRLTVGELKQALAQVERLSFMEWPHTDWSVAAIEVTHQEWHRQKMSGERFRTIFRIHQEQKEIHIVAILARDENTYSEIVRRLYLNE